MTIAVSQSNALGPLVAVANGCGRADIAGKLPALLAIGWRAVLVELDAIPVAFFLLLRRSEDTEEIHIASVPDFRGANLLRAFRLLCSYLYPTGIRRLRAGEMPTMQARILAVAGGFKCTPTGKEFQVQP